MSKANFPPALVKVCLNKDMKSSFRFDEKDVRILVVDDMSLGRATAKRLLKELGFTKVDVAENGRLAWQAIEDAEKTAQPFGLIVSDWVMPEMTGIELLAKVKAAPFSKVPSFVMLTAESDATVVAQAIKAGVAGYIRKPVVLDELKRTLMLISGHGDRI